MFNIETKSAADRIGVVVGVVDLLDAEGNARHQASQELSQRELATRNSIAAYRDSCAKAGVQGDAKEWKRLEADHEAAKSARRLFNERNPGTNAGPVKDLLRNLQGTATRLGTEAQPVKVAVRKGGTLAGLSAKRGEVLDAIKATKAAPVPFEEAARYLSGEVDKLAKAGAPKASLEPVISEHIKRPTNRPLAGLKWPTATLNVKPEFGGDLVRIPSVPALLCWAMPEAVKASVLDSLKAAYERIPLALTNDERAKRLKALERELEGIEREMAELAFADGSAEALAVLGGCEPVHVLGVRA